jgi:CubicO group peptidase (beta-lactamase class C family)
MHKFSYISLLLILSLNVFAQTNALELRNHTIGQTTIDLLNNKKAVDIYALFDSNMQRSMSKQDWVTAVEARLYPLVPISKSEFLTYNGAASFYSLATAANRWSMQIATNNDNLITTLFFSPLKSEIIQGASSPNTDDKTDKQAQLIRKYFNQKNTDSIYALTNDAFKKKVSGEVLKQSFEAQLFPYGAITNFQFIKSVNNVSKYKADIGTIALQILVGLDKEGKVETFFVQPFKDENSGVKRTEIWHDNALISHTDSLVHNIAQKYMETTKTPSMSLAILQDTKAFFYNYGEVKLNADQHPLRTTLYEIGSITKTFTAFLLADAVVNNKVKLEDAISKYLPATVAKNKDLQNITLQQLANHTSGLPRLPDNLQDSLKNPLDPYADYDTTKLYQYLQGFKAQRKPGEKYEYSNLAFGLLGTIMERVYNQPLEQLYHQIIFRPFKMNATYSTNIVDSTIVAAGYNDSGVQTPYWNFSSLAGCGSIKSNTEDLLKYALQFTLKPRTKGKSDPRIELLEKITYQQPPTFVSLGWHFDKASNEARTMSHNGGTYGFRSNMSVFADKKLAIVVLCNSGEEPGAPLVAEQLKTKILAEN